MAIEGRSTAGGNPAKTRRRKTATSKRRNAPKAAIRGNSSTASHEAEVARLTRERDEALEQQTATSEVLRVISSSQGELQPVFESMLANATRVCQAQFGHLLLCEGDAFHNIAMCDAPSALAEKIRGQLFRPHPESPLAQAAITKQPVQVHDLRVSRPYLDGHPAIVMLVKLGGARTLVGVPMLSGSELVGVIILYRNKVHPFTDKQVALVQNFAAQAVIAVENARLLTELRQRTADLAKSLEQQTATAEVLGVISRSKFDLQPVLQSVVDTAARLCRAEAAGIFRLEEGLYRFAAGYSLHPDYLERERKNPIAPGPGTVVGRAAVMKGIARIDDALTDPLYEKKDDARIGGYRSMIGVPLMRDGEPIGGIGLARCRVEPFSEREIELVTTFADQAVIAIENVRLFEAEQQRTRELTEVTGAADSDIGGVARHIEFAQQSRSRVSGNTE